LNEKFPSSSLSPWPGNMSQNIKNIPYLWSLSWKTQNQKNNFSSQTQRHAESFEVLDSSPAQSPGKNWDFSCKCWQRMC